MLWKILLLIFMFAGLLSILIGIPGTFTIVGFALIYAIFTHFQIITVKLLFGLLAIAIMGEVIEAFLGLLSARKFGASGLSLLFSVIGSFAGALIGSIFLGLVGTVIGAICGAFLGAFLPELAVKKKFEVSVHVGFGAFLGRTAGILAKLVFGAIMIGLVAARLF